MRNGTEKKYTRQSNLHIKCGDTSKLSPFMTVSKDRDLLLLFPARDQGPGKVKIRFSTLKMQFVLLNVVPLIICCDMRRKQEQREKR